MKIRKLGEYCKSIDIDCDICEKQSECKELTEQLEDVSPYGLVELLDEEECWIPVTERLPEEKEDAITQDYVCYQVTVNISGKSHVRCYKFGGGHWWNGPGLMDEYVKAWRERPEPYKEA